MVDVFGMLADIHLRSLHARTVGGLSTGVLHCVQLQFILVESAFLKDSRLMTSAS